MYFYELHEGDEEVFSDVLLATEHEMDADEFFELVQSIRRSVQDTYEDLLSLGSMAEARKAGRLRSEGKTYWVRDGDVVEILFSK